MYGVVYCCTINNKQYVGQTRNLKKRIANHEKANSYIGRAIRKHGKENATWEILVRCEDKEALNKAEIFFISTINSVCPNGYNLTLGGEGGIMSSQAKYNMSMSRLTFLENLTNEEKRIKRELLREKIAIARYAKSSEFWEKERIRKNNHFLSLYVKQRKKNEEFFSRKPATTIQTKLRLKESQQKIKRRQRLREYIENFEINNSIKIMTN